MGTIHARKRHNRRCRTLCTLWQSMTDPVLIIDADPAVRGRMAQLLHLEGFAPFTAATGPEALQFLRAGGPAKVILLDLRMPMVDGWTLPATPRCHVPLAEMPVVVLKKINDGHGLAVAASFTKPLDFARVVEVVRDLCRDHDAARG